MRHSPPSSFRGLDSASTLRSSSFAMAFSRHGKVTIVPLAAVLMLLFAGITLVGHSQLATNFILVVLGSFQVA